MEECRSYIKYLICNYSFEELNANPTKAKKPHNRPKTADEFAKKFYHGFYDLVEEEDSADSKSSRK